jgi:hypothetical protein
MAQGITAGKCRADRHTTCCIEITEVMAVSLTLKRPNEKSSAVLDFLDVRLIVLMKVIPSSFQMPAIKDPLEHQLSVTMVLLLPLDDIPESLSILVTVS